MSYLSSLQEHVDALWKCLPPENGPERVVSAVEVQDEMDEFGADVYHKIKELATGLNNLRESVTLIEKDKDESWEAVSHRVSTMVESSVGSLTERLTELEQTVQSQGTTPVTDDDVLDMKTWSTLEQVIWAELNKVKETAQEVPNIYTLCEGLQKNQKSQEKQITVLRNFARQVERYLAQLKSGAVAPKESTDTRKKRGEPDESLGYVPGASASSSAGANPMRQSPTPPQTPTTHGPKSKRAIAPRRLHDTPVRENVGSEPLGYVSGASVLNLAMASNLSTPTPPTIPPPPIPTEVSPTVRENASASSKKSNSTRFSTVRSEVRSGAIRVDITDPHQWEAGDVAVLRNQEAKKVRDIGSLG